MNKVAQLVSDSIKRPSKRLLARFNALPNFIIIGAMKAGTSSLFHYLSQHPQILAGTKKEVHFFDANYEKSEAWYRQHFPLRGTLTSGRITGEATPSYIFNPHVAHRIHQLVPRVKLIVVLRNPTARAISHYYHEIRLKRETLPIMEALMAEEERVNQEWERLLKDDQYRGYANIHFSYKKRGKYLEQLENYWRLFDKSQMLILSSEEFFLEPKETLKKAFDFLNVDSDFVVKNLQPKNVGIAKDKKLEDARKYLDDYFIDPNQKLYQHLNMDFKW